MLKFKRKKRIVSNSSNNSSKQVKQPKQKTSCNNPSLIIKNNSNGNGKLTALQARFVEEYLVDLNATRAAIRAGYSKKGAEVQGCNLLSLIKVQREIQIQKDKLSAIVEIDQEWVLKRYKMLVDYSVDDFFNDDGTIKSFSQIPKDKLYAIGGFKQSKTTIDANDKKIIVERIKEFKLPKKKGVLDSIGKYLGMFEKDNEQKRLLVPIQINIGLVD